MIMSVVTVCVFACSHSYYPLCKLSEWLTSTMLPFRFHTKSHCVCWAGRQRPAGHVTMLLRTGINEATSPPAALLASIHHHPPIPSHPGRHQALSIDALHLRGFKINIGGDTDETSCVAGYRSIWDTQKTRGRGETWGNISALGNSLSRVESFRILIFSPEHIFKIIVSDGCECWGIAAGNFFVLSLWAKT